MDRGEGLKDRLGDEVPVTEDSVAAGAGARVGAILARAERDARAARAAADGDAEATLSEAREEAERLIAAAERAAADVARDRAGELARIQASIAARAQSLVEGLEGSGLTRARLEALIDALGQAAERILAEAGGATGPVSGTAASVSDEKHDRTSDAGDPDAAATPGVAPGGQTPENTSTEGSDPSGPGDAPDVPEGAPMARKPRTRRSDARFAAVLLAVQGRDRGEVEAHLREEYGLEDGDPILDEVFGSGVTRA